MLLGACTMLRYPPLLPLLPLLRLLPLLALLACSDYGMNSPGQESEAWPILQVDPGELHFDPVPQEEQASKSLSLSNAGDASLKISELLFRYSDAFYIEDEDYADYVSPGETIELDIWFTPGAETDDGVLEIESDDPASPITQVPLFGSGLFPILEVDPDPYDYDEVLIGCGWEKTFLLRNIGQALLRVEAISHSGACFSVTQAPPLPLELEPKEEAELVLSFDPLEPISYEGSLLFSTNEPVAAEPSTQTGLGMETEKFEESWRQPDGPWEKSDILFYVDQSGSMSGDQANLRNNFEQFTDELDEVLSDYQIMAVTADDGCHNEQIITQETADAQAVFSRAVDGPGGTWTEAGLTLARNALLNTGSGQCNEGFGRDDAKVMLVLVSDEPEQSQGSWDDYVVEILKLEPTTGISAIAGDVPGGGGCASAGYGYYEASMATGGLFFSICDSDWGSNLQLLAELSTAAPYDCFTLAGRPVRESTIEVLVDGELNQDWTYEPHENAVCFAEADVPEGGSYVEISYYLECED